MITCLKIVLMNNLIPSPKIYNDPFATPCIKDYVLCVFASLMVQYIAHEERGQV